MEIEMNSIIGGSYRITEKLGEGGGGVVYKGEHIRLRKTVVLKEDRRSLHTHSEERLRREVDTLKDLHHTYLPQVYDFVPAPEQGVVYTVIDYIDGVSLDKPLAQGIRFPQKRVIRWARQLLEALVYLHSRPPHGILHADIKPANIMLMTPEKNYLNENSREEIRLIDFNIALFLKEDGAVRVGFSDGYASPEHYGLDYSQLGMTHADTGLQTELPNDPSQTILPTGHRLTEATNGVLLDVRSDIYSLGATLYHLLTGEFPNPDATLVRRISQWSNISDPVARIIEKAMNPNPNLRYQTADEMLHDFRFLYPDDIRTHRHRHRMFVTGAVCAVLFLSGIGMLFTGMKQIERRQNALTNAEYSASALRVGDIDKAISYALEVLPEKRGIFDPPYTAQAQRALTNALGVYKVSDGYQPHTAIYLPSEPIKTGFSPDGQKVAVLIEKKVLIFDTESGQQLADLEAEYSAMADFVFQDNETLLYAGEGALTAYDLTGGKTLWKSSRPATGIALSADKRTVAAVYKDENIASIYDAETGEAVRIVAFQDKRQRVVANDVFADPKDNLFALDDSGQWLAVSFSGGGLRLFNLNDSELDIEIYESSGFTHFEGGFSGTSFAFVSTNRDQSEFEVIDLDMRKQTGGLTASTPFHVQADESGIYLSSERILVKYNPQTGEQSEIAYANADITGFVHTRNRTLMLTKEQKCLIFDESGLQIATLNREARIDFTALSPSYILFANRDAPVLQIEKWHHNPDSLLMTYDADFKHDEARVSDDFRSAMLYRFDSFRIVSCDGQVIISVKIPDAPEVYDQQYRRRDGNDYLEVIYNDGSILHYSARTGELISDEHGEEPDRTLYEEFETTSFVVRSPLHGAPDVYDRESGKLIRSLDEDAYLAYVTQMGDNLITEYVRSDGTRYGLLLNSHCEVLADLPQLSDILPDGTLVFDDMQGNLRRSRLYSLQELLELAKMNWEV